MAVVEGKRGENRLEIFVKALDLATYTVKICGNEKTFPVQYKDSVTDDVVRTAKDIYILAWEANNILVNTAPADGPARRAAVDDWMERRRLQKEAARKCNRLLSLIGISKSVFHLEGRRVRYWTGKTLEVRAMIRKWNESDNERYSKALG